MKKLLITVVISLFTSISLCQNRNDNIKQFVNSFTRNFSADYFYENYDSLFSFSLLIIEFNKKNCIKRIKFSDSAPSWQKEELTKMIKHGQLDLKSLTEYAKKYRFRGILLFPTVIKSIMAKQSIEENDISLFYNLFSQLDEKLIAGNILFQETIVLVAPKVIPDTRAPNIHKSFSPPVPIFQPINSKNSKNL